MLNKYEGVIAADTGHISMHEAGAIEFTGHKVLSLPSKDGKINALDVEHYITNFYNDDSHEHMIWHFLVWSISHIQQSMERFILKLN